jgi:DNA polymerase III subunit epsilon
MREIIFDTETTGLDPKTGDRLVEIGCVEVINRFPTGKTFHVYLNPERDMPEAAFNVHGLSAEFLKDKPLFGSIADEFETFIAGAQLVAHNATFDVNFINAEMARVGKSPISMDRVVDTVQLARRKFPGARNSLDALCERFGIDNSRRTKHGALLDSEILAEVYVELLGGRQASMTLDAASQSSAATTVSGTVTVQARPEPLVPLITEDEIEAHAAFVKDLGEKALWNRYIKRD